LSTVRNQEVSARGRTGLVMNVASVHYREVVRSWEGQLWEVPL